MFPTPTWWGIDLSAEWRASLILILLCNISVCSPWANDSKWLHFSSIKSCGAYLILYHKRLKSLHVSHTCMMGHRSKRWMKGAANPDSTLQYINLLSMSKRFKMTSLSWFKSRGAYLIPYHTRLKSLHVSHTCMMGHRSERWMKGAANPDSTLQYINLLSMSKRFKMTSLFLIQESRRLSNPLSHKIEKLTCFPHLHDGA